MNTFNEANEVIHRVEDEWHYKIMTKYNFQPTTKTQKGFVRCYEYQDEKGYKITANTGIHADYWTDKNTDKRGYHASLEPYLKNKSKEEK